MAPVIRKASKKHKVGKLKMRGAPRTGMNEKMAENVKGAKNTKGF